MATRPAMERDNWLSLWLGTGQAYGEGMLAVGIDVGADRIHAVMLDESLTVVDGWVASPFDGEAAARLAALKPTSIAIDGPDGSSAAPYRDDFSLAPKWRTARGCEVELGLQRRIWVSFATPSGPLTGWMAVAADLFDLARRAGHTPLEVYPHAVFRTLAGRRLPKKTTAAGIDARVAALEGAGVSGRHLALWSHDALDAAAAAVVAAHHGLGWAVAVSCTVDNTTIWLPGQRV